MNVIGYNVKDKKSSQLAERPLTFHSYVFCKKIFFSVLESENYLIDKYLD